MVTEFWIAVAFLMIGIIFILLEMAQPGFFIAVPGGTLVIMGGLGLAMPGIMFSTAGWFLWPTVAVAATLANLWAYKKWAPAGDKPITMSIDSLPGEVGEVTVDVTEANHKGKVRIRGSTWSATTEGEPITAGTDVRVVRVEGVHVIVEPVA